MLLPSTAMVMWMVAPPCFRIVSPAPADDDDEPTVPITINGPQPLANEAQDLIKQIIASKRARTTQHVRDIPAHIVPFVKARRSVFVEAAEGGDVELSLRSAEREVSVSGDRETVLRVIEAIKSTIAASRLLLLPSRSSSQSVNTGSLLEMQSTRS
jgi:hypothetical protein